MLNAIAFDDKLTAQLLCCSLKRYCTLTITLCAGDFTANHINQFRKRIPRDKNRFNSLQLSLTDWRKRKKKIIRIKSQVENLSRKFN
jgi:hypothetical protein